MASAAKRLQVIPAGAEDRDPLDLIPIPQEWRPLVKLWLLPLLELAAERGAARASARRPDGDRGLTTKQVAERLAISPSQVRHLIAQGELTIFPIGKRGFRISEESLNAYIQRHGSHQ